MPSGSACMLLLCGRHNVLLLLLLQRSPPVVRFLMQRMVAVVALLPAGPLLLPLAGRPRRASRHGGAAASIV